MPPLESVPKQEFSRAPSSWLCCVSVLGLDIRKSPVYVPLLRQLMLGLLQQPLGVLLTASHLANRCCWVPWTGGRSHSIWYPVFTGPTPFEAFLGVSEADQSWGFVLLQSTEKPEPQLQLLH